MFKLIKLEERIVLDASALLEAADHLTDSKLADQLAGASSALAGDSVSALDALSAVTNSGTDVAAVVSELTAPAVDGAINSPTSNNNRLVAIASNVPGYAYIAALAAQSGRVMVFDPQLESLGALLRRASHEAATLAGGANAGVNAEIEHVSIIADMRELAETSQRSIDSDMGDFQPGFDVHLLETSRQLNTESGQDLEQQLAARLTTAVSVGQLDQQVTAWQQQASASGNGAVDYARARLNIELDADSDLVSLPVRPDAHPDTYHALEVQEGGLKLLSHQALLNHPGAPVFIGTDVPTPLALAWQSPPSGGGELTFSLSVEHGRLDLGARTGDIDSSAGKELELSGPVSIVERQLSQIRYTSDQGFSGTDTLAYGLVDMDGKPQVQPENIWLQVVPASAPAPLPQARGALLVSPETEFPLENELLSYASSVDVVDLYYQIRSLPEAGEIMRQSAPLQTGDLFSQSDIDDGLMSYRHVDSSRLLDEFQFVVTDGIHESALDTLEIRIVGNLELLRNSGIDLNSGTKMQLDSTMLQLFATGIEADQLIYEILETPRYGELMLDGEVLVAGDVFTQANVDAGLLSLQSHFYGEPGLVVGDSFHFAAVALVSAEQAASYLPEASFPLRLTASEAIPAKVASEVSMGELSLRTADAGHSPNIAASEILDYAQLYGSSSTKVADVKDGYGANAYGVQAAVDALNGFDRSPENPSETAWLEINDWDAREGGEFAQLRDAAPYADTLQLTEDDMLLYRLLPDIAKTGV